MRLWEQGRHIYLATKSVDFRKSIDGLSMLLVHEHGFNPGNGDVYVFYNKARNRLKLIYYDTNGFMMCYKRLEEGKLIIKATDSGHYSLNEQQLRWLLTGLDFITLKSMVKSYGHYA